MTLIEALAFVAVMDLSYDRQRDDYDDDYDDDHIYIYIHIYLYIYIHIYLYIYISTCRTKDNVMFMMTIIIIIQWI